MAYKVILKHSSILGRRPNNDVVQPGEIALNTNSDDPGAFFETADGNVIKIGPTSVSDTPPVDLPERGESWLDVGSGDLKIGTVEDAKRVWRSVAAPFLGGGGNCVFVAPEFPYSSDRLTNNGQSLPFQTITRAVLELSKLYIGRVLSGFSTKSESNRYTIFLAPSTITVNNDRGISVDNFSVDFSDESKDVLASELIQFNPGSGGVIIPFGISIQGMDLKKSVIYPTYVPNFRNPAFPVGLQGSNQPVSSILKCTGNTYLSNFTATDKIAQSDIVSVSDKATYALFRTEKPHGLRFNDLVDFTFYANVDQSLGSIAPGAYYCIPYDSFRFFLSTGDQTLAGSEPYISSSSIPDISGLSGPKFSVSVLRNSAHRLRLVSNASLQEIGDYFTKVQRAFSSFFGGQVTAGSLLVNKGDYEIVGPTSSLYPDNEVSNTVANSSLYANQVNLRSEYGMCWGDFDGALVEGFRSVVVNACTAVSIQNDPRVYEIYTTLTNLNNVSEKKWWNLTEATFLSLPVEDRPASMILVPRDIQLDLLNSTPINNIRYYYATLLNPQGKSIGIVDVNNDFRHFGFRVRNGAYAQLQSIYTIGAAIGVWALNGGVCNLTNSTSNFGSVSFKAEGFSGINSIGGANPNSKGFVLEGVERPLALTKPQVESSENKRVLSLGARVTKAYIDPSDISIQILELGSDFKPNFILPYSLKPGSAVWVDTSNCTYRGFFAVDGGPTLVLSVDESCTTAKLRLRSYDSTIPNDPDIVAAMGIPYIRRFRDPRTDFERCYSLYITNTSPTSIAPQVGSVLRLNQTSQQLGADSLKPNVQFDPGVQGGWGRVFTVDAVETGSLGAAPQFNYVIADTNQDLSYYIAVTATDYSRPWYQGEDFKTPSGSYTTHNSRNWYSAENNLWEYVYYSTNFNTDVGPYSLAPTQEFSPFVDTSVVDKQEPVGSTYQGVYATDSYLSEYLQGSTYMRGATAPYPTYSTTNCYDDDDSSEDLGLCLKNVVDNLKQTVTIKQSEVIQEERDYVVDGSSSVQYRPEIIEFSVLSSNIVPNPRQKVSVLYLSTGNYSEYVRVISLSGVIVKAIRLNPSNSAYRGPIIPNSAFKWPEGTSVKVCNPNPSPEGSLYDPEWSLTKRSILRFFEVMGYSNTNVSPLLTPKGWGDRLLPVDSLKELRSDDGYAIDTKKWPLEFNQPSSVIANTHTWAYTGYYNYSRGLLKFQTTDITRKLASDFQASTLWSGRVTVTGVNDKGEIVQFGPQRQALTANYYDFLPPVNNSGSNQVYETQYFNEFPAQVIVYSADDISGEFDGVETSFLLTAGGTQIPPSQLAEDYLIVTLGAVIQAPFVDYYIDGSRIVFTSEVPTNVKCDVRVVTTDDSNKTLVSIPLVFQEAVNGSRSVFTAKPKNASDSIKYLDVNSNNTFVIIGGVEQIPLSSNNPISSPWAYSIDRVEDMNEVQFTFSDVLPAGVTVDIRVITTGSYWSSKQVYPVAVYSLDTFSDLFNGSRTVFDLTYRGNSINPDSVTENNLIVSLGGAIQIPGVSYKVEGGQLRFISTNDIPVNGTSLNLRVITNSEFISCQLGGEFTNFMEWGPPLVLELEGRLDALEGV